MAPIAKRKSIRAKAASAGSSTKSSHPAVSRPVIQPTKKAKREEKHKALLDKITKSTPTSRKNASRRRNRTNKPKTALETTLESLVDALPSADAFKDLSTSSTDQLAKFREKKSITSRPGAQKKKEKVVKEEIERFGRNLAVIQGTAAGGGGGARSTWEAIRGFVGSTLERKEEFVEKEKEKLDMEVDVE